jgi:hypothetical protein
LITAPPLAQIFLTLFSRTIRSSRSNLRSYHVHAPACRQMDVAS